MYRIEQFELTQAHARSLHLAAGTCLRVSAGRVWLTAEGFRDDIWLQAGEQWQLPHALRLWISAEPAASLQVLHPAVPSPRRARVSVGSPALAMASR
jgi:hypothetical protein